VQETENLPLTKIVTTAVIPTSDSPDNQLYNHYIIYYCATINSL